MKETPLPDEMPRYTLRKLLKLIFFRLYKSKNENINDALLLSFKMIKIFRNYEKFCSETFKEIWYWIEVKLIYVKLLKI